MKRADIGMSAASPGGRSAGGPGQDWTPETFGDHLTRELRARNWTLRYLALRAGVDHSTISRLMQGDRLPTLGTARRLHAALGGPDPLTFFGGAATPRADPVRRVEEALRADPALSRAAVRELLDHYHRLRQARRAELLRPPGSVRAARPDPAATSRGRTTPRREMARPDVQEDRS